MGRYRFRAWRGDRSTVEVAELLGCCRDTIRKLERGKRKPGRSLSFRIFTATRNLKGGAIHPDEWSAGDDEGLHANP